MRWPWMTVSRHEEVVGTITRMYSERCEQQADIIVGLQDRERDIRAEHRAEIAYQRDDHERTIEWYRAEIVRITEQLVRIERRRSGLPEEPREPRTPQEPMPRILLEYCNRFGSASIKKFQRDAAYRRYHMGGETWEQIIDSIPELKNMIAEEARCGPIPAMGRTLPARMLSARHIPGSRSSMPNRYAIMDAETVRQCECGNPGASST
jgi:hypothetical protein